METNNYPSNKEEIIQLILADMRNRKLLMGLESAGLPTDDFTTNLSELIFSKIGIPEQHETHIFNWYEDTVYSLLNTDLNKFREHQLFLAERLYDSLEEKKNSIQRKKLIKESKTQFSFLKWVWFKRWDN